MKKIAVVILTKNEEKNIVAVIENVRKITDEIIIIDSGSDDATMRNIPVLLYQSLIKHTTFC